MTEIKSNTLVYYWDNNKDVLVHGMVKEQLAFCCYVTPMDSVEQYAEEQACFVDEVVLPSDAPAVGVCPEEVYTNPYACLTAKLASLSLEKTIAVKECRKAEKRSTQCSIKIKAVHKVLDDMVDADEDIG